MVLCKAVEDRMQEEKVLMYLWIWNYVDREIIIDNIESEVLVHGKSIKTIKVEESS